MSVPLPDSIEPLEGIADATALGVGSDLANVDPAVDDEIAKKVRSLHILILARAPPAAVRLSLSPRAHAGTAEPVPGSHLHARPTLPRSVRGRSRRTTRSAGWWPSSAASTAPIDGRRLQSTCPGAMASSAASDGTTSSTRRSARTRGPRRRTTCSSRSSASSATSGRRLQSSCQAARTMRSKTTGTRGCAASPRAVSPRRGARAASRATGSPISSRRRRRWRRAR